MKIAFGNHRTDCATSYPFRALSRFWQHVSLDVEDHISKGDVIIGSDVWIGADVFIGSGVKVGSGAVLGAKAVITRDVPPYAVVVGNPGKVVKLRFAQEIVAELLDLKWWDLEDDVVDTMIPLLLSPDVDQLIVSLRKRRANG